MSLNIESVTLESKDGKIRSIPSNIAACSVILEDLISDLKDTRNQPILVPVEAEIITDVFNWCKKYNKQDFTNSENNSREIENSLIIKETRHLKQPDICKLFKIIKAANYFDIGNLLDTGYKSVAFIISDIDLDEIQWSTIINELLQLTYELYNTILETLSQYDRHSYLRYLTRVPYSSGQDNANRIREAIASDISSSQISEKNKPQDILKYFVDGWNTKDLTWDVIHSKVAYPCDIPGWYGMEPTGKPNQPFLFVTDRLHILLGTSFTNTSSLVLYDVLDGKRAVIDSKELASLGWPQPSNTNMSSIAFHSGLIIIGFTQYGDDGPSVIPRCFQLSTSPLKITRLDTPRQLYDITEASCFAINEEFICVSTGYRHKLSVYSRDFVLKGCLQAHDSIWKIFVKGKTIITLQGHPSDQSLYYWQLTATDNPETSLIHIKTISLKVIYDDLSHLILNHNLDMRVISGDHCFYFDKSKLNHPGIVSSFTNRTCVDELSGQYCAAYNVEQTSEAKIIKLQISNLRHLEKKKSIAFSVPLELGVLLNCKMYFTTFILFFTSGIARVKVKEHESIYRTIAASSGGVLSWIEPDPEFYFFRGIKLPPGFVTTKAVSGTQ